MRNKPIFSQSLFKRVFYGFEKLQRFGKLGEQKNR